MDYLRLALAQINTKVGDLRGNFNKVVTGLEKAKEQRAHIVLFPELTLCGYPPEDLLLKSSFLEANQAYLKKLIPYSTGITAIVGFVDVDDDIYNAAAVLHHGKLTGIYRKYLLPNYGVFDEERYFKRGDSEELYMLDDLPLGVSICEDIWYPAGPPEHQAIKGAKVLLNISASPYYAGKVQERERMLMTRAADNVAVVAYCNLVGGQDELIFDGSSIIINQLGQTIARAKSFEEDFLVTDIDLRGILRQRLRDPRRRKEQLNYGRTVTTAETVKLNPDPAPVNRPNTTPRINSLPTPLAEVYEALKLGTRDYVRKNGFSKAAIGLSGGIDSALVAVVAADALGPENVAAISMPSRYSSDHSKSDAAKLAHNLGIRYETVPIEPIFNGYLEALAEQFAETRTDVTEENLQSRARGNILMAMSNKFGWLVLTTGNKSEMAVGYATLYGDMAGGFAVIKDVPKTLVYQLCEYRNTISPVIPTNIITKAPSAELREDQFDTDSLPPYDALDKILWAYVEQDYSVPEIVSLGFDEALVRRIITLVDRNEYKRRQAPPGVKISSRAFGKDRRLPLTNGFTQLQWDA